MSNLLPEENKKKIFNEFILKSIIVFFVFLFVLICVAIILLIPSYVLSEIKGKVIANNFEVIKKSADTKEFSFLMNEIKKEQSKIDVLSNFSDFNFVEIFEDGILINKSDDIKINGVYFEINGDKEATSTEYFASLIIKGISKKRSSLIVFIDKLKAEDSFLEVYFPVSSLAKEEDINFSIKIAVNKINH